MKKEKHMPELIHLMENLGMGGIFKLMAIYWKDDKDLSEKLHKLSIEYQKEYGTIC